MADKLLKEFKAKYPAIQIDLSMVKEFLETQCSHLDADALYDYLYEHLLSDDLIQE